MRFGCAKAGKHGQKGNPQHFLIAKDFKATEAPCQQHIYQNTTATRLRAQHLGDRDSLPCLFATLSRSLSARFQYLNVETGDPNADKVSAADTCA
ncbi:hypothetical protein Anapl_13874 [Anas platyrhynchos]|uniref:Uncharacterized protein n=1 Tax=Anas platyrhynchos TaxID=8839 RepID=R0KPK3_ANAPL|nr:hypothetical protein Anapl_13874 [Anas platyrhynchos]